MKIKLNSDFIDYYDHEFCGSATTPDAELNRWSKCNFSKQQQFDFMLKLECNPVPNGMVKEIASQHGCKKVVVYHDVYSHRGEDKRLMDATEALEKFPSHFCSLYVPSLNADKPMTIRQLFIGDFLFVLQYSSNDEWRSNCGEVEILFKGFQPNNNTDFPLYAIDFIEQQDGKLLAIDVNLSPGIKGTPIEKMLKPKQIYDIIAGWIEQKRNIFDSGKRYTERCKL